jgi:soluble lytic murein transglycosylase-like protein
MAHRRRPPQVYGAASLICLAILMGPVSVGRAVSQEADFSFRRVRPPASDAERLIAVQIELKEPSRTAETPQPGTSLNAMLAGLEPLDVEPANDSGDPEVAWFWERLTSEKGPGRMLAAAALLDGPNSGAAGAVSQSSMRRLGLQFGAEIARATRGRRISPALVLAVMMVESAGRPDAVSQAGAAGLMQLMPATAKRFLVRDRFDSAESIRGGVAYLDWLLAEFGGDPILALAGYNAGENAVRRHRGIPPYPETRAYVPKVVAAWRTAAELCTTRQISAADRCELNLYAFAQP